MKDNLSPQNIKARFGMISRMRNFASLFKQRILSIHQRIMNSRFRTGGQFRLSIHFVLTITQFLSQNQLLPVVNAVNGVIWDKKSNNFVRIFSIKGFDNLNEHYFSISRATETHDFNGTQLRLTAFTITNLFDFPNNNTGAKGVHGELWELLSEMLNFKITYIRADTIEYGTEQENGSWDGLMGYIYRNETDVLPRSVIKRKRLKVLDFVMPMWTVGYGLCVAKRLEYDRTWMARLFSPSVSASIFGIFLALSIASFLRHSLSYNKRKNRSGGSAALRDHFFHMFSILCNQGWISPRLNHYSKMLTVSTAIFSWLIYIAFSSTLTSHITQRKFREPFGNLDRLYCDTNYKVVVKRNSLVFSVFRDSTTGTYRNIIKSNRLIEVGKESQPFQKMCTGKYAFFEAEDIVRATNTKQCEISCIGRLFNSWAGSAVSRGFKNKRTIDLGIVKLHEVGIIDRLKKMWLMKNTEIPRSDLFESIRLVHVSLIFDMLFCGIILSLGILLIENIIYRKKLGKR